MLRPGWTSARKTWDFVNQAELLGRLAKGLALVTLIGKQLADAASARDHSAWCWAGRPNVGKAAVQCPGAGGSALVSPEAGTTGDYLVQQIEIEGTSSSWWTRPAGTANGAIEAQCEELGREQAGLAHLLLLCLEAGVPLSAEEGELLYSRSRRSWRWRPSATVPRRQRVLPTSAVTGTGLERLRSRWPTAPALTPGRACTEPEPLSPLIHVAARSEGRGLGGPVQRPGGDSARGTARCPGSTRRDGRAVYTDDLLDRIFSRFCIGK